MDGRLVMEFFLLVFGIVFAIVFLWRRARRGSALAQDALIAGATAAAAAAIVTAIAKAWRGLLFLILPILWAGLFYWFAMMLLPNVSHHLYLIVAGLSGLLFAGWALNWRRSR